MSKPYLNKAQFSAELEKCLQCPNKPCAKACPAGCSPHDFIAAAKENNLKRAASSIAAQNPLGETCGLICPDKFCVRACLRQHIDMPIKIPLVQAEIMRQAREKGVTERLKTTQPTAGKVAIIGAGPAGIGAAAELVKYGFAVTVFERESMVGGALNMIPAARLPHEIVAYEWQRWLDNAAVEMRTDTPVTEYKALLRQGFAAVIVAVGEQKSRTLGIDGEFWMVDYTEYLKNPQPYICSGHVGIIGGGAAAVDCAVTAAQNGANHVEMFVRRRLSDMRITAAERDSLLVHQVDITTMTRITKIEKADDMLTAYTCKTRFNDSGKLEDVPHTEVARGGFALIVSALGSTRAQEPETAENIFYAGDFINGGSTAVEAVASGKQTAQTVIKKLRAAK